MKHRDIRQALACVLLVGTLTVEMRAQEWTRFRGPNGTGVSQARSIPAKWTESDINWKVQLTGAGHSSPVIWANKVFLTSADDNKPKLHLYCINTGDGATFWHKEFELSPYALHRYNNFASSSPTVDQKHVYLASLSRGHYKMTAFDHSGKTVWERDFGSFETQHGAGTSPIVHGGTVVIIKDQDGESFAVALDAEDGKTRWQTPLRGSRADYSTPCIYETGGSTAALLFTSMEDGVIALDADSGKPRWQLPKVFSMRCVSSPVIASGLIVGSCGSGGGGNYVAVVRPGDPGNGSKPQMAYTVRKSAPYVPTSLALGSLLFLWSDAGIVTCLDAPSGETKWQERVGGNYFASPICIDGRLFGVSTSGEVVVLEASEKYRELARNHLNETSHATPAVSGGRMYVRTLHHLISVGGEREAGQ